MKPILGAFVLSFGLSIGAAGAAVDYWAFGDSITRGEGGGEELDNASGTSCPSSGYPTKCGYHWRLEDSLDAAGVNANVINRGEAGEGTGGGLSRINDSGEPLNGSRCADSSAKDVLLLMEGTNDISNGISNGTILANLEAMLDLATEKCVHSVIAPTIRRLLAGTPIGSTLGDPDHNKTSNVKGLIKDLALAKDRAFVNVYKHLCKTQGCYDDKFWGRFGPGDPGHVNKKGYNDMAPLFHDAITDENSPQTPTLTAPTGDITDTRPAFSWPELSRADWYFLEVQEADGSPVPDWSRPQGWWHPEEGHAGDPVLCSGSVCSRSPFGPSEPALATGDYRWRVKARNLRGNGNWSAYEQFTVWAAAPAKATTTAPAGSGCEAGTGPYQPSFTWDDLGDAKDYRLQVEDASMTIVHDETLAVSTVCTGGNCSTTPTLSLPIGEYTWRVQGTNPAGDGPWSDDTDFSLYPSTLGAPPTGYPAGDIFDTTPTYRWSAVVGAEEYDLDVDATVTTHAADTVCVGSLCEATGSALTVGPHTWAVAAINRCDVSGTASPTANFEILTCGMPIDRDLPDPGTVNSTLTEAACGELRALAGYIVGGTGDVTFHAGSAVVLDDGFSVESGGTFTARVDY